MNRLGWSCTLTFKQFVAFLVTPSRSKNVRTIVTKGLSLNETGSRPRARTAGEPNATSYAAYLVSEPYGSLTASHKTFFWTARPISLEYASKKYEYPPC